MSTQFRQRTSLFFRIVVRLCVPLVFLGLAFMIIQLSNKVGVLNEMHELKSRMAISAVRDIVTSEKIDLTDKVGIEMATKSLSQIAEQHSIEDIYIYNLLDRTPVLESPYFKWTPEDVTNAEKSIGMLQKGKPYFVTINKTAKKLIAYIPRETDSSKIFITRVIFSLGNVRTALSGSFKVLMLIILMILITGAFLANSLAGAIIKPIKELMKATEAIKDGRLGERVKIDTGDEIEALSHTFNAMSGRLKLMQSSAEDSNPLTKLPGNDAIEQAVQQRIYERQKFVFFHIDIDRFKVFNDFFGLAAGDKAIKGTADVLKKARDMIGSPDDFIGHQGGDDFVMIVKPNKAKEFGDLVCKLYDEDVTGKLYPKEDLERGYTLQIDRRAMHQTGEKKMREFPLMAISLAGISNTKQEIADYGYCMKASVKVKKMAKEIEASSCIIIEDLASLS